MLIQRYAGILTGLFFSVLLLGTGCSKTPPERVDRIRIMQGANQSAPAGTKYAKQLRLELLAKGGKNLWGAPKERPAAGFWVRLQPQAGSDLKVTPNRVKTDAFGVISVDVQAGHQCGDQILEIIPEGFDQAKLNVRFLSGLEITGAHQECRAGHISQEPVKIRLHHHGRPVVGVPVRFELRSSVEGTKSSAKIITPLTRTNKHGEAETYFRAGQKTGSYEIGITVGETGQKVSFRPTSIEILGFNALTVLINVFGGLAFFIFGMVMMSDGIKQIAGENMKKLLSYFTSNRIFALLAGTVVTGVLQSSAATTLMVIGFINAGLLNLGQSIGIIFGANIGTTVTAQLISFNLSGIALPAIGIGFFMTLARKRTFSGWGTVLLGFGLLFFGMTMMSDELKILGEMTSFQEFFKMFDCIPTEVGGFMPLGAVLGAITIGIIGTIMIQSSSAFTGIVLALATGGLVNFYTSVPLLIGSNIGTTVTTQLGAITANRVAKQAALAHTLFNVFGAVFITILLYIPFGEAREPIFLYFINLITPGNAFAPVPQNLERHIAMAHTFFNILVSLMLLPFVKQFANLCNRLMPVKSDIKTHLLEPGLLNTPSVALKLTAQALQGMLHDAWHMIDLAVNEHFMTGDTSAKKYEQLEQQEEKIDQMQSEITSYLVRLTQKRLTEPQSELIPLMMHCTNDVERIGDHTENILLLNDRLKKDAHDLSQQAKDELKMMWDLLNILAHQVIKSIDDSDPEASSIKASFKEVHKLHKMASLFESEHIDRLRQGQCTATVGVVYIEMLGELVKIGDRLSNIAERMPEVKKHYVKL